MWNIGGYAIAAGEKRQIVLRPAGTEYEIPATAICGAAGDTSVSCGKAASNRTAACNGNASAKEKTVVITAGVHCDEYPAVAAVIRTAKCINPSELFGRLLLIHSVNYSGFRAGAIRSVPEDGGNLNAIYPGSADGSLSQRIAHYFVKEIFPQADFLADFHSGSVMEPLSPCLFFPQAEGVREKSLAAAMALSIPSLIESRAVAGEYSYAANVMGIPGLLLERGHSGCCFEEWIADYERDIRLLLKHLGMYMEASERDGLYAACAKTVFTKTIYLTACADGLWYPAVQEAATVQKGQLLGHQEDIYGNALREYRAEEDGFVFYYTAGLSVRRGDALVAYGKSE